MARSNSSGPEASRKDADFEKREAKNYRSLKDIKELLERKAKALDGVPIKDGGGACIGIYFSIANDLPPVYPKSDEPSAEWLGIDYDGYADGQPVIELWECSNCGYEHEGDNTTLTNYCPNCGAKMESEDDNAT